MSPKARSRKNTHSNVTERKKTVLFGKEVRLKEENNFAPKRISNNGKFPSQSPLIVIFPQYCHFSQRIQLSLFGFIFVYEKNWAGEQWPIKSCFLNFSFIIGWINVKGV